MSDGETIPNGSGAAAILAAGIGSAAMGIVAFAGDASERLGSVLDFYDPVGPLSGVTTVSIVIWLAAWFILSRLWATKSVALGRINQVAFAMLLVGFLLTFPPIMDFLQGK